MQVLAPLGAVALSVVGAGVGVLGLFDRGSDDDGDLSEVARRLDAREDPDAVARKLDALDSALDALVAEADLGRHLRDPPAADASSVEKAEALSQAVRRGQLSVGPASDSGTGSDGAFASAAATVERETSPSSPAARRLLDAAAGSERIDSGEAADALERAADALDTRQALERALEDLPEDGRLAPNDARRARSALDHPDNEVTEGVRQLVETAERDHSTAERRETERERFGEAADRLTDAAADEIDLAVGPDSGRPAGERLSVLADAVDRGELRFAGGEDGGRTSAVAREIRRERRPESAVAKRLLDRLASSSMGDLRAALDTAVEQLDAATTTQSLVADLDPESVRELVDDVEAQLDGAAGPVADALSERVEELRGMLDRADESNAVIPYAVRSELRFYDRTLVSALGGTDGGAGASAGAGGSGSGADVSRITQRKEDLEDRYVDGRRDHNHSIPLHFLSLVDALRDDAERAAASGDDERAAGLVAAADETLDHVEQLYERNEYSVMLRRLRG